MRLHILIIIMIDLICPSIGKYAPSDNRIHFFQQELFEFYAVYVQQRSVTAAAVTSTQFYLVINNYFYQ